MKSSTLIAVPLFALVLASMPQTRAQENTWNIVTLAGDTLSACILDSLTDTSLNVHCSRMENLIPVDSISVLFREGKSTVAKGALVGGIVGAAAGLVVAPFGRVEIAGGGGIGGTIIGQIVVAGMAGALVGGAVGTATGRANSYELEQRSLRQKLQIIRLLLLPEKLRW